MAGSTWRMRDSTSYLDSEELTLSHERTYVNEYVNHLQAVNFDIRSKYEATEGNDDARLALQAMLEGDSAIGEFVYTSEHFTPEEQEASILEPNEAFREALNMAPYIAIRTFAFPFVEGLNFAVQLFQAAGNWSSNQPGNGNAPCIDGTGAPPGEVCGG